LKKILLILIAITIILPTQSIASNIQKNTSYEKNNTNICNTEKNKWVVIITAGEPEQDQKNVNQLKNILDNQGYNKENILELIEENATRDEILTTPFEWLNQRVQQEDLIIFYFCMHGGTTEDQQPLDEPDGTDEFLVAYKKPDDENTRRIIDEELTPKFNSINCNNIFIIIEACYSGGMIDGDADIQGDKRIIITSASKDESSYPFFLKNQWLFPYYMFKGLNGAADINNDKTITAEESYEYAKKYTMIRSFFYGIFLIIFHKSIFMQHPKIYDGWPTIQNNEEELEIIKL